MPLCKHQAFGAGAGGDDIEVEWLQKVADKFAVIFVVVDHHDALPRAEIAADAIFHDRGRARVERFGKQKLDPERAALADGARHADFAAHDLRQQARDGEAEAGAGGAPVVRSARALERQENALQIVGVNADAGVGHDEFGDLVAIAHLQRHRSRIGELDRVRQEIDQDLAQAVLVGVDRQRQPLRRKEMEFDAARRRLQLEHADKLVEEFPRPDFGAVEMEASGLDLGNVEQAVDQPGQMLGAVADHLDRARALRRDGGIALEHLGIAEDGVQWRAQLVT